MRSATPTLYFYTQKGGEEKRAKKKNTYQLGFISLKKGKLARMRQTEAGRGLQKKGKNEVASLRLVIHREATTTATGTAALIC